MDPSGAISSFLLFRPPAGEAERAAAERLCGREAAGGAAVFVLAELGADPGSPAVEAAVMVLGNGPAWTVLAAGGRQAHFPRLASDLVRAATGAGAGRLVTAPDAPRPARQLLRDAPVAPEELGGWLSVTL